MWASVVNERVWKLIRGYVKTSWKGIALSWLVYAGGAASSAVLPGRADAWVGWLSFEVFRSIVVMAPLIGGLFIEREVATLPVSRADLWRARWLLATVGLTILSASGRATAFVLLGRATVQPGDFALVTVVEFLSAGTWAACAPFWFRPANQFVKRAETRGWIAFGAWFSAMAWSIYVHGHGPSDRGALTPVVLGPAVAFACATYFGFRAVPAALHARVPRGAAVEEAERRNIRSGAPQVVETRGMAPPGNGVARWVWRELLLAVGYGAGALLVIVPLEMWLPLGERRPTVVEAMSVIFRSDFPIGLAMFAVSPLMWLSRLSINLRLLRSVPLSMWTLVCVLTGGPVLNLAALWSLQVLAYRWSSGGWPSSPPFSEFLLILTLVAAAKTVSLQIGSRYVVLGTVVALNMALVGLPISGPLVAALATVPAVASSVSLVLLLMFADHMILTRTGRLYRASTSVV